MTLVVLLKGVNVGGHRTFRPSVLAKELERFDIVNIGAAGTLVVRTAPSRSELRSELMRRLPFAAEIMICNGSELVRLASSDPFANQPSRPGIVRFVSLLARRCQPDRSLPFDLPSSEDWCLRVLQQQGRFVLGVYRREMRAIRCLDRLDAVFGVPVTTRSWSSILAIVRVLKGESAS
jgi:uncharacterized protein (DUF1697 family)